MLGATAVYVIHKCHPSALSFPSSIRARDWYDVKANTIAMTLTDDQIKEFQMLYLAHGNKELSNEEATILASEVVAFVAWLYKLDERDELRDDAY